MQHSLVFEVYQYMSEKNIFFSYTGTFDHFTITALLKGVKRKLKLLEIEKLIAQKIHSVLVEKVENIRKYGAQESEKENTGILLLGKTDDKYIVITGNKVLDADVLILKEKLERIAGLSVEQLKQEYRKQILIKESFETGAGLGLIDIAIKSGNGIKYEFKKHGDASTFYFMQTEISIK